MPLKCNLITLETDKLLDELRCEDIDHACRHDIGQRLAEIGDPRPGVGVIDGVPDILWRPIQLGEVEIEGHGRFKVGPFSVGAYQITAAQVRGFLDAEDGFGNDVWWDDLKRQDPWRGWETHYANHPAIAVSWNDATAFCRWLSARLGFRVRLPDEWEWQWAAQSARSGFNYPWGPLWRDGYANTDESKIGRTTAVGMYPNAASAQGVFDLAGNVWEWTRNKYDNPRRTGAGGEDSPAGEGTCWPGLAERLRKRFHKTVPRSEEHRVLRGGSWDDGTDLARAQARDHSVPFYRGDYFGFRVLCESPIR